MCLQEMGWKQVAFVLEAVPLYQASLQPWQAAMAQRGVSSSSFSFNPGANKTSLLQQVDKDFRVIILGCYNTEKRDVILTMKDLGLKMDDYAIITFEATSGKHNGNDGRDNEVREAMSGMISLHVATASGDTFDNFITTLSETNQELEWRQRLHGALAFPNQTQVDATDGLFKMADEIPGSMTTYAAYLYDAVKLYALGLHEVLESGGNSGQTYAIQRAMQNQSFLGKSGMVQLNENGDRAVNSDFLNVLDNEGDVWPVVARYDAASKQLSMEGAITWMDGSNTKPFGMVIVEGDQDAVNIVTHATGKLKGLLKSPTSMDNSCHCCCFADHL